MKNRIFLISLILTLNGCGQDGWLGEKDNEPKLSGKRLTVLKHADRLIPDEHVDNVTIKLPSQENLSAWSNSNGSQYNYPDHIKLGNVSNSYQEKRVIPISRRPYYLTTTPVVADDIIYIMNGIGNVFAYKKDDLSKPLWVKHLAPSDEKEEIIGGGLAYSDGVVFATSGHKDIVALKGDNGKELWRHALNNITRAAPIVQENKLFAVTIDNKLYALDKHEGNLLWVHEGASETIGIFGAASIAADNGIIVTPHSSGQLHGLSMDSGEEIWSVNLSYNRTSMAGFSFPDIDVTPVIRNGVVYVAGNMGLLYAIDLSSGILKWQREIKGIKSIWVAGDFLYTVNASNELICIYNIDGRLKWIKQLDQYKNQKKNKGHISYAGPVLAGENLIMISNAGKLLFISPYDGKITTERNAPSKINLLPVIVNESLYLLSNSGNLVLFK
jgi:outer membrane protein assembly factor BamB